MERSAGILLPIFSLPGEYGIGTLGKEARAFVDFLHSAGQRWWQILPVGPTVAGNSPYTSESTFAGNPLLIDPALLAGDGLLAEAELASAQVPNTGRIDYAALHRARSTLLYQAYCRARENAVIAEKVRDFAERTPWLRDYVLYRAAKRRFENRPWFDWEDPEIRRHEQAALGRLAEEQAELVEFYTYEQFWFFSQWEALKQYANGMDVRIIGDLPFYVSLDSADVWAERKEFLLDQEGRPSKVAGVPPDYFSEDGQLWGNPLYRWDAQKQDGFGWWIRRVEGASKLFDAIRIDHFRGMESYWAVPAESKTAKNGIWEKGPGIDLLGVLVSWFPQITYIAEDLGILTDQVHELRDRAGLPGMRVLEFAFSGPDNSYLPHNYRHDCVCYTGTHDNDTLAGWYTNAGKEELAFAQRYLGVSGAGETRKAVLRCGLGSVAQLFVAQIQDYLGLGSEARINVPGVAEGNWNWRLLPDQADGALAEEIRAMTQTYGR